MAFSCAICPCHIHADMYANLHYFAVGDSGSEVLSPVKPTEEREKKITAKNDGNYVIAVYLL